VTNTLNNPTRGLQTFGRMDGGAPTAGMTPVWIASTDASLIFRGDPIVTSSAGGTNNSGAYITAAATGTGLIRGVFQGCYQYQPSAGRTIWSNFYNGSVTGSTGDVKAYIVDDPDELFLGQGSTNAAITSSYVGLNIGFLSSLSSAGNTTTGYSNVQLASSAVTNQSTYPFRIVDFYSAYAPTAGTAGTVNYNSSVTSPLVNGTDNSNPANIIVVRMNNCDRNNLTARSS